MNMHADARILQDVALNPASTLAVATESKTQRHSSYVYIPAEKPSFSRPLDHARDHVDGKVVSPDDRSLSSPHRVVLRSVRGGPLRRRIGLGIAEGETTSRPQEPSPASVGPDIPKLLNIQERRPEIQHMVRIHSPESMRALPNRPKEKRVPVIRSLKLPTAPERTFPVEVEESIIDQLENVEALRCCALVCRTWRPRTRYHLVRSIRIRTRAEYLTVCDFFQDNHALRSRVQTLTLEDWDPRPFSLLGVALVPLLQLLPLLRRYRLVHHGLDLKPTELQAGALGLHQRSLTYFKQYARGVQELHLESITFRDPRELARLTMSMPSLRHLHCVNLRHSTGDPLNFTAQFTNKSRLLSMNVSRAASIGCG